MNSVLEKITKWSFISLATIPLFKENINSILIIICAALVLYQAIKSEKLTIKIGLRTWMYTIPFWMFFLHEVISLDFNIERILLYLPFLIFPLIFSLKPKFIDEKIKHQSLIFFQTSVIIQVFIYVVFFLANNPISKFFYESNNIPFFREYVSENYFFEIHPTYFSSFLLISFTISLFNFKKDRKLADIINMILMMFFIFLFSSRIIFLILLLTILGFFFHILSKKITKQSILLIVSVILVLGSLLYITRNTIKKRFNELRTEINKPIKGDYYNSTNTRVAIIKCTLQTIKNTPFFGFGNELQTQLNNCYKETNQSNFYTKHTFNTHNFYFHLIAYGGWLFFLVFIGYIWMLFKRVSYSILGVYFLIQFLLINLTENYLSRHYGIVVFVYFLMWFVFSNDKKSRYEQNV